MDSEIVNITSFIFNKNMLWIASDRKLYAFEENHGVFKLLADTLIQVNCMEATNTNVWIGTKQNGLIKIRYNKQNSIIPNINLITDSLECDNYANSGGSEISIKKMNLGKENGVFILEYNMFNVPDKITIFSGKDNRILYSTKQFVSGKKKIKIQFSNTRYIIIRVDGNSKSTQWKYKIQCPN